MGMNVKHPLISVVVACKDADRYARECVQRTLDLDYPSFELILLPDSVPSDLDLRSPKLRVRVTGPVLPSVKRNIGVEMARGEIIAFEDSDAFPRWDWLKNAVKYFNDPEVAAVGGPGVTPDGDGLMQRAGGAVLSSFMGGGGFSFRYTSRGIRECDDLPTVNLLVRRSVFEEVGGFDESYWPGEDTEFCLRVVHGLGKKILYAPDVVVFHHRRPLFVPHLRQISGYGLHRGFFAKKLPETSRRLIYFLPSILVASFGAGSVLSLSIPFLRAPFLSTLSLYFLACFVSGLKTKSPKMAVLFFFGTVLTHLCYGVSFLRGVFSRRLRR